MADTTSTQWQMACVTCMIRRKCGYNKQTIMDGFGKFPELTVGNMNITSKQLWMALVSFLDWLQEM